VLDAFRVTPPERSPDEPPTNCPEGLPTDPATGEASNEDLARAYNACREKAAVEAAGRSDWENWVARERAARLKAKAEESSGGAGP
jgi:hypothetical protein